MYCSKVVQQLLYEKIRGLCKRDGVNGFEFLETIQASIVSMDLCSLNSLLSPPRLSVPLRLYVLSTLSPLCLPPSLPLFLLSSVNPSCLFTALCLALCLHMCHMSLTSGFSPYIFPLCLFPFVSFPLFLLLSLPFVTPSVFSLCNSLCLSSVSLLYFSPLPLLLCLSSWISSLLSPSLHLSSYTLYVSHI